MKVRFWFCKKGLLRFISHLDTNRTMIRALNAAKLPVSYSCGFNPRPLLTFALPLSLGICSECETMDVVTDRDVDFEQAVEAMNAFLPAEMSVSRAAEAVCDPKVIKFAKYRIMFSGENAAAGFDEFMAQDTITVEKKTKSGSKNVDIKPLLQITRREDTSDTVSIELLLPAGTSENVNPFLLTGAFCDFRPDVTAQITRIAVLTADGSDFA